MLIEIEGAKLVLYTNRELKMEFVCPVCKTNGNMTQSDLNHPVTKATCRNCGIILLINPADGSVDAFKSPLKDSPIMEASEGRPTDKTASVLSMSRQGEQSRDWTAVLWVAAILIILISAGFYVAFTQNIF